jgi:tetratricopeptide (TPR) repeat protein
VAAPGPAKPAEGPKDFGWYMLRGRRLLDSRPAEALDMFKKASQLTPSSPEPYSARGLAYTNMERWDAAIESFNEALVKSPEYAEAVIGLAEAYRYKGDKEKALLNYQKYLEMAPNGPDARAAKVQADNLRGETVAPAP